MSQLVVLLAEAEVHSQALPFPSYVFAIISFAVFAFLGFVAWSFRDVANRHSHRMSGSAGTGHGDGGPTTGHETAGRE